MQPHGITDLFFGSWVGNVILAASLVLWLLYLGWALVDWIRGRK